MSYKLKKDSVSGMANSYQKGFTLIELLVTVAIMAIVASIAIPSFSQQLAKKRVDEAMTTVVTNLRSAKAESVIQNSDITVTFDPSANTITTTMPGNTVIGRSNIHEDITLTNTSTQVQFTKNKTASANTIKICDKNATTDRGYEVTVTAAAVITTKGGITCS